MNTRATSGPAKLKNTLSGVVLTTLPMMSSDSAWSGYAIPQLGTPVWISADAGIGTTNQYFSTDGGLQ